MSCLYGSRRGKSGIHGNTDCEPHLTPFRLRLSGATLRPRHQSSNPCANIFSLLSGFADIANTTMFDPRSRSYMRVQVLVRTTEHSCSRHFLVLPSLARCGCSQRGKKGPGKREPSVCCLSEQRATGIKEPGGPSQPCSFSFARPRSGFFVLETGGALTLHTSREDGTAAENAFVARSYFPPSFLSFFASRPLLPVPPQSTNAATFSSPKLALSKNPRGKAPPE